MRTAMQIFQIVLSLALIVLISIQSQNAGLGSAFGLGGSSSFSRRGLEKFVYKLTFITALIFTAVSIMLLFL
jgi:protein translocase SecG subunit